MWNALGMGVPRHFIPAAAAAHHQHGIADLHFGVQSALRAGTAAECFLRAERLGHEMNQAIGISAPQGKW